MEMMKFIVIIVTITLILMEIAPHPIGRIAQPVMAIPPLVLVVGEPHPIITTKMRMMIGFTITIVMTGAHTPLTKMVIAV
jgi:hypothetical protein